MNWTGMYFLGFVIFIGGLLAALWKLGVLEKIGTAWTLIGLTIAAGIGIMLAVARGGGKHTTNSDRR